MARKFGALVHGANKSVQLDSNNFALSFIRKQKLNLAGGIQDGNQGRHTPLPVVAHNNTKIFAMIPSQGVHVKIVEEPRKNNQRQVFVSQPYNDISGTVEVFEFGDVANNLYNEKYGMVIRNSETKKVVYNSNWGTAEIVDYFNGAWQTDHTMSIPNNANLAFALVGGTGGIWRDGVEGSWSDTFLMRNGTNLSFKLMDVVLFLTGSTSRDMAYFPANCIILDVTKIRKVT